MIPKTKEELASFIDHTLLAPTGVRADIERICKEAIEYKFVSVCVLPKWVVFASEMLRGSGVKVCTVAGFPLGAVSPRIKAFDAEESIMAGADEVDMVADLAAIIEGDEKALRKDMSSVLKICQQMKPPVSLKVIIESAALTDEQIRFAAQVGNAEGVDYLKTSTGMHKAGGASVEAVKLMSDTAPRCKIKAAGGIRTTEAAMEMIKAGANRIGASASIEIIKGFEGG